MMIVNPTNWNGLIASEVEALLRIYHANGGASWANKTGWLGSPAIAGWYGITTIDASKRLTDFRPSNPQTSGTLDVCGFPSLVNLYCGSSISALDVSTNVNLVTLNCSSTSISALDVSTNVNLVNLYCGSTSISTLDVSTNIKLVDLRCNSTSISTLDVSTNINLVDLRCYSTSISTLDVSTNIKLVALNCYSTSISALDVSTNVNLVDLRCYSCGMLEGGVDSTIASIYNNRMSYTAAAPSLQIGGTNAAPTGIYQYAAIPTTGKEMIYALVNDDDAEGFNTWAISYTA